MLPVVTIKVDSSKVQRRLSQLQKHIEKSGQITVAQTARLGRDYIQALMPRDTGKSADSIGVMITASKKGVHTASVFQQFSPHPEKRWGEEWFNLPLWMFKSTKALNHFRTGDVAAMRAVPKLMFRDLKMRYKLNLMKA